MIRLGLVSLLDPAGNAPELAGNAGVRVKIAGAESQWAVVMTPRAGGSGEARFWPGMPSIGERVIVGYLDGDPGRPVVLGSLFAGAPPAADDARRDVFLEGAAKFTVEAAGDAKMESDTVSRVIGDGHTFRIPA